MSDEYFEQMGMDKDQKDALSINQQHTGVDLGLHYVDPNSVQHNIMPGGGSIRDWHLGNNSDMNANEIQNLKMQLELQKQIIELLKSEITVMKERLDNYLKYERRRIGTTDIGPGDKRTNGAEQSGSLSSIRHEDA